jgi:uncharacterized Fe-S cluster-containing radical SAM superfamily protein
MQWSGITAFNNLTVTWDSILNRIGSLSGRKKSKIPMMDKIEPTSAGFDPLEEARLAAQVVCGGDRRKYYRFRPAKFYGGIATADCLGCCLRCLFCWSWPKVIAPGQYGKFYSPAQVAGKLTRIALKKGFHQLRISGNEPTIARDHLIKVLELIINPTSKSSYKLHTKS